jgi:predicted nucleotidyltransferase
MLFHPLNGILGSTAKVQILRALLPLTSPVSGREAQKLARIRSRSGAGTALEELSQLGVLQLTETRGSHLYQVNHEHELVAPLYQLFRQEENRLAAFVSVVRKSLVRRQLEEHVRSLILYGSNARRDVTPKSDVDLLVVVESEHAVNEVTEAVSTAGETVRRRQGLRVSPYVLTAKRARERAAAGDPLLKAVRTEGRLLMGEALEGVIA